MSSFSSAGGSGDGAGDGGVGGFCGCGGCGSCGGCADSAAFLLGPSAFSDLFNASKGDEEGVDVGYDFGVDFGVNFGVIDFGVELVCFSVKPGTISGEFSRELGAEFDTLRSTNLYVTGGLSLLVYLGI